MANIIRKNKFYFECMKIMTGLLQRVNYFWAEDQSPPHIYHAICLGLFKFFMSNINDWEDKI